MPLPVALWADKLESGNVLKWVKTKEAQPLRVQTCLARLHGASSRGPAPDPQAPALCSHLGAYTQDPTPVISETEKFPIIVKWSISSHLCGGGERLKKPREKRIILRGASWKEEHKPALAGGLVPARRAPREDRGTCAHSRSREGEQVLSCLCLGALGWVVKNLNPFLEKIFKLYKINSKNYKGNQSYWTDIKVFLKICDKARRWLLSCIKWQDPAMGRRATTTLEQGWTFPQQWEWDMKTCDFYWWALPTGALVPAALQS